MMKDNTRFRELLDRYGVRRYELKDALLIPEITLFQWYHGLRTPPDYVIVLIEYFLMTIYGAKEKTENENEGTG